MIMKEGVDALLAVVEARSVTSTWSCIGKFGQGEAGAKISHGGQIANLQTLHQHSSYKSYT